MRVIILVALIVMMGSSQAVNKKPDDFICVPLDNYSVRRCIYKDGTVCFIYSAGYAGGISCMPPSVLPRAISLSGKHK